MAAKIFRIMPVAALVFLLDSPDLEYLLRVI